MAGGRPLALTARPRRAAIHRVTIQPDGVVTGTARGGGVLGAHQSENCVVGALGDPGAEPRAFSEPAFAQAPLHVDGQPVAYPPDRVPETMHGEWRWIVTATRIVGATTHFINLNGDLAIPAGTKFVDQGVGI